ncbi:hypothetical protein [Mannheimia haemolytica]|uniref:hypothetical protein n=1 Tax=Mannheimia haemolytica TaxID=75985 RepID=UPI0009B80386|nr:hypothetical protein [Mannheimia haemolytica]AJE08363.2 hypothetical protein B824_15680 [Mannheimia haemolytica USDA-ARS-USMARC-184]UFK42259.1 hypothetical protein LO774_11185 [Mannheimia haemolytica]UQX61973.1 hypothetical protein M3709_07200 [Mannheimia haemolytica]HDL1114082.1 hypothetical protein [Mannheimia haemolytica]HDL1116489.1 hypothetical protein [Mannheimia haemolytica]
MSFVLHKILTPMRYLKISHKEKLLFDYILPAICAALFIVINEFLLPYPLKFLGDNSIVSVVNGILQMLSGFYIASLAAIATFNRPEIDEVMLNAPRLNNRKVTRRIFLTHLFGYLAFMSILTYFIGGFAQISQDNIVLLTSYNFYPIINYLAMGLYSFIMFNLVFVTLLGLFFMIDRIHHD